MAGRDSEKAQGHFTKWLEARGLVYVDGLEDIALQAGCRPGVDNYYIKLRSGMPLTHALRVFNEALEPLAIRQRPRSWSSCSTLV